ncbi:MAG: NAD-dependent epimerase/dehydratase family protein, partial [bacterium]|nr:NAD-dependent epimerase/dehydratase family protein [bacterium]
MRRETVFIVGATGFVGSHLTARLLKEGRRVIALVQPKSGIAPHRRLNDIIAHIDPSVRTSRENLIVIPGSIRRPPASWLKHVRNMGIHHIDAVWNLAVLFNVSQGKKQEVKEVNIQGVQHILEFVSQVNNRIKSGSPTNGTSAETIANPPRYYHVSTAYSSGKGPGPVTENIKTKNLAFHSLYDWSKHAGECLVKQYRQKHDLDAVIFRPSIVVCARHSNIINCTAYYKVVEVLYNLRKRAENALGKNF